MKPPERFATIVIPARLRSQRLPEKLLLRDTGQPLIWHTVAAAQRCKHALAVVVATDSLRIAHAVDGRCPVWLDPDDDAWCGTQRAARALCHLPGELSDGDVLCNWQADEPLLDAESVDHLLQVARSMFAHGTADVVTMCGPGAADWDNPDQPKVVLEDRTAVNFCRVLLPCASPVVRNHCGFYALSQSTMAAMTTASPTTHAIVEQLEQLNWIADGRRIHVVDSRHEPQSINTIEDYRAFVQILHTRENKQP